MKKAPTPNNTSKNSANQKTGNYIEAKHKERLNALETLEKAKKMEHIKKNTIKYLLK